MIPGMHILPISGTSGNEKSGTFFDTEWQNLTNQQLCQKQTATLWHCNNQSTFYSVQLMPLSDILSTSLPLSGEYLLPIRGIRGGSYMQNSPVVKSASKGVVKSSNDIQWQKETCFAKKWQEKNVTRTNFAYRVTNL